MSERVRTIDEFQVGDEHRERRVVSDAAVRGFAELSGDKNRIHLDDDYARSTRFGARIAHGALLVAYVSKALGMDLPGPGAVYLSQSIEFQAYQDGSTNPVIQVQLVSQDQAI